MNQYKYMPKIIFEERMNQLLKDEEERKKFWKIVHTSPPNSIRCNTLKITPDLLKKRLEEKQWQVEQLFKEYPEIMVIKNPLLPGELGKSIEHLLGYYYIQEISSMLPILCLKPSSEDSLLDLCASPGSKTTQASCFMKNKGLIIANDNNIGRLMILASNLEKNAVANVILTRKEGSQLCSLLDKQKIKFDKILVDAPCSGEGTLRSSPATFNMWNVNMIRKFSKIQKQLASSALKILKNNGDMIYSTCTHAPEENEEVVQYLVNNFKIKVEPITLPLKTRPGILEWNGHKFDEQIKNCVRIYPQDNDTEGFFIAKLKKLET